MDIINNNPYRLLGVFANSPTRERVANVGKLKAFLKVGKQVSFPLDLTQYLPPITRTISTPTDAEAKLTLPADQIKYAQFWFIKSTTLDDVAFNHLFKGDMGKAIEIWNKRDDVSSLQNRITCALIRNNNRTACALAQTLYHNYPTQFVEEIIGKGSSVPKDMGLNFLDELCQVFGSKEILNCVTDSDWKKHISQASITPIINRINNAIASARESRGKGPSARYAAGIKLMNETKGDLALLKTFLSTTDLQYQMVADKLGQEILQCGIDYFNDTKEDDAPHKAMKLQGYALSVVVGKMAKDRCQENVDILKKIIAQLPPSQVSSEDKAIREELRNFSQKPSGIYSAERLLTNTQPYLITIKTKLGQSNSYYLKISTLVVSNALGDLIKEVNQVQNDPDIKMRLELGISLTYSQISQLKTTLSAAWRVTRIMDNFDLEPDFRANRYLPNRSTLLGICNNLGVSTTTVSHQATTSHTAPPRKTYTPRTTSTSRTSSTQHTNSTPHTTPSSDDSCSTGCIIAIIVILVILCLLLNCGG